MDEASIAKYITDTFAGAEIVTADGNRFFFYGAGRMMPFATLVTNDQYDQASNLNRPSVFRLNVGVGKQTCHSLFSSQTPASGAGGEVDGGYDFTALDQIMPHPVYAPQSWICVLNPSDATFETVRALLAEAYDMAVRKHAKVRPADSAT